MFSTRFTTKPNTISWIDIGTPDDEQTQNRTVTTSVQDDYFWSVSNGGVRFGEDDTKAFSYERVEDTGAWVDDGIYTILDTGASDMYMSILWFDSFVREFYAAVGIPFEVVEGAAYAACAANYPNLYFQVNQAWIQVPSEDYLVEDDAGTQCRLRVVPIDAPFNIFGMPAFLDYYVTHNWEKGYISIGPHADSLKPEIELAVKVPE